MAGSDGAPVMDLSAIEAVARDELDAKFAARELAIANSRKVIRASANAIRALHRAETAQAEDLMKQAGRLLREAVRALKDHPDILHAGFVSDAAKEYAEARITAALVADRPLPLPADLGVDVAAYLKGMGEAVGELRRRLLDALRDERLDVAQRTLQQMDQIVDLLASLDYPDGMTGGLRRVTDVARSLAERSRADLTATVVQARLRAEIARHLGDATS